MSAAAFNEESLEILDRWIRQGQVRSAQKWLGENLRDRRPDAISRRHLPQVAALCRRAGIPEWSLRLLNSTVRPRARMRIQSTALERAEYGAALVSVGAISEARSVLESLSPSICPEADLYRAFSYFATWDYEKSLPLLARYLAQVPSESYISQVARINFAAALIATQKLSEARPLLERLLEELEKAGDQLLLGNAWTLLAQCRIQQQKWAEADAALRFSEERIGKVPGFDSLIIGKWRAIWRLRTQGLGGLAELRQVRARALEAGSWETVRDCDFHEAKALGDRSLWARIYFGTPYASYRARISVESGIDFEREERFAWLWKADSKPSRLIDCRAPSGLKAGQVPHRMLLALSADLYRPRRLAALHEAVFPGRYYNPLSSPDLIHQGLRRVRDWLRREKIPLRVIEKRQSYSLQPTRPGVGLIIHQSLPKKDLRLEAFVATLKARLGADFRVSRAQTSELLGVSSRSAYALLSRAAADHLLEAIGRGPSRQYRPNRN